MSIDEAAAELGAVIEKIRTGLSAAEQALRLFDEARDITSQAMSGTSRSEATTAMANLVSSMQELGFSYQTAEAAEALIQTYLSSIAGHREEATRATAQPFGSSRRPQIPAGLTNRHGDRYPDDATPDAYHLPPRVITGTNNSPIIGHVRIDGKGAGEVRATRDDEWTREVVKRIGDLGLPRIMLRVANHVEMKCAVMVALTGAFRAEVILNHAPCGSQPRASRGCDQYLPAILPAGATLTVLGTDADGNPFKRTYEGKAAQ